MSKYERDFVAEQEAIDDIMDNFDFRKVIFIRAALRDSYPDHEWLDSFIDYNDESELRRVLRKQLRECFDRCATECPRISGEDPDGGGYYRFTIRGIFETEVSYYEIGDVDTGQHYFVSAAYNVEDWQNY